MSIKSIEQKINSIRVKADSNLTIKQKITKVILILLLGAIMGFGAKSLDGISILGEIGSYLGVWIFTATLIAAYSRSPRSGALHVFTFFLAMLLSYYLYTLKMFGIFPKYYFFAWGGFALLSPICAYLVWYSRGKGKIAALCASLPIAMLILEGYSFYYTFSIARMFDLLMAAILFSNLSERREQKVYTLIFSIALFFLFAKLNVISFLFGGL